MFHLTYTLHTDYLDTVLIGRQADVMVNVQFSRSSEQIQGPARVIATCPLQDPVPLSTQVHEWILANIMLRGRGNPTWPFGRGGAGVIL